MPRPRASCSTARGTWCCRPPILRRCLLIGGSSAVGTSPRQTSTCFRACTLASRYRADNDLEAAKHLVLSHLRFVVHIARGYAGYGLQLSDLIQEGNVGLLKAVKRFDPTMQVRLVSFAVHWIRAEMHEFILRNWRIVKVATTKAQRKLFFNLRSARKALGWMGATEVDALAKEFGVETHDVLT